MPALKLEDLAVRLEAVERELADSRKVARPKKGWRELIGTMEDNEFTRAMLAEIEASREAERVEARARDVEESSS